MKYYVGLDVGADGAISVVNENKELVSFSKFPKDREKLSELILKTIRHIKDSDESFDIIVGIEDVHSLFVSSKKSNFNFGVNKGVLIGIVETIGMMMPLNIELVHAKVWQNKIWKSEDKVYFEKGRSRQVNTKGTSLNAAKRLFPTENFLASSRSKVPHDGIVDATLIAMSLSK